MSDYDWSALIGTPGDESNDSNDFLSLFLHSPVAAVSEGAGDLAVTSASSAAPFIPFPDFSFSPDYSLLNLDLSTLSLPLPPLTTSAREYAAFRRGEAVARGRSPPSAAYDDSLLSSAGGIKGILATEMGFSTGFGEEPVSGTKRKRGEDTDGSHGSTEVSTVEMNSPPSPDPNVQGDRISPPGDKDEGYKKHSRGSKACTRCRFQKMRCNTNSSGPCQRCIRQKAECIFADVGVVPPPTSTKATRRAAKARTEKGAGASVTIAPARRESSASSSSTPSPANLFLKLGITHLSETKPLMLTAKQRPPSPPSVSTSQEVLVTSRVGRCMEILTTSQVEDLFTVFYDLVNPSWSLLVPDWHTPAMVGERSPLLLLSICTITSRFHPPTQHLYSQLYTTAREDAASALVDGARVVETVQACLLLAMWAVHPAGTSQDIGWLLICFASRLAADLGLQRPKPASCYADASTELVELENANRVRTWMLTFALDRSYSLQRGRIASLSCRAAQLSQMTLAACSANPESVGIAGYMELQALASEALETLVWSDGKVDYGAITGAFESKISGWQDRLHAFLAEPETVARVAAQQLSYWYGIFDFYRDYWCLVVFSFGLQNALDHESPELAYFFFKCASFANSMLKGASERLSLHPYFKHAPDSRFVFLTYAAVCLMKFAQPSFQRFCPSGSDMSIPSISQRVLRLADLLNRTAVDEAHMPAICAAFLKGLVGETTKAIGAADSQGPYELVVSSGVIEPLVSEVLEPQSWTSMVIPGFDGRERPSTANFLRSGLTTVC